MPQSLVDQPLAILFPLMAGGAVLVWYAGSRLAALVDEIARRTALGEAFAGMLLLGGITSLPELATASAASLAGNPLLSINDVLGTSSINILLLAAGDAVFGKRALTHWTIKPAPMIQGVLGMILMAAVAIAIALNDVQLPMIGVGLFSLILAVGCVAALRISNRFEHVASWNVVHPRIPERTRKSSCDYSNWKLGARTAAAAVAILLGGATLALTGDQIAERSGFGSSIIGFALIGFCTSLPELSSIVGAMRLQRYQLALGNVFGTNLFNIQIIFVADLFYSGAPVLNEAGIFEIAASCLSVLMTGIFVVGMLERRDKTFWNLGRDSALAILVFAAGLLGLATLA